MPRHKNICCSSCTSTRDNCRLERRPSRVLGCPAPIREPLAPAALTGTFLGRHSPARLCRTEPVLSQGPNWFENLAGKAAWVRKSSCQGNLPVPGPALPWSRGDSCRGSHLKQGDTNPCSHTPPSPSSQQSFSYHQAFATGSCVLVTERVTGWQRKRESGKDLVPGLIQDVEPTILTQLMARG